LAAGEQAPWDVAKEQCSIVAATLRSLGIDYVELGGHLVGEGLAVSWAEDNYVVLASNSEGLLYLSSGALWDVSGDRLATLEACNDFTHEFASPAMFLFDDEDDTGKPWRSSVLLQQKYPVRLVKDVPPFFAAALETMRELTPRAREMLAERGMKGTPYQATQHARLLFEQCLM